jgi:aspartate dehydrogenase
MKVGIIGCGFIGGTLAKEIEFIDEITELYLYDHNLSSSEGLASGLNKATAMSDVKVLIDNVDLVIEAATQDAVREYSEQILNRSRDLMVMSVGALVDDSLWAKIKNLAVENNCKVFLPSGAICGIDGLKSASMAVIDEVTIETTKPPKGLEEVRYITKQGIDFSKLTSPLTVFDGPARDAVKHFPKNVNIAACVSLAGIGFDKTKIRIIVDPAATRNQHKLICRGRFGSFTCVINNMPSITNPKTSYLAALSAIGTLKKVVSGVWIGT